MKTYLIERCSGYQHQRARDEKQAAELAEARMTEMYGDDYVKHNKIIKISIT